MKALVGTFNQEKALVGAFSVIVQLHRLIDLGHYKLPSKIKSGPTDEDGQADQSGEDCLVAPELHLRTFNCRCEVPRY